MRSFLTSFKLLTVLLLATAMAACSQEPEVVTLPDLAPMSGDAPMFRLGPDNLPLLPPVVSQLKYEYYQCDTLVSDWFLKLLLAEMNFLEKESGLVHVDGSACAVSRAINQGQAEPRFTVNLFNSRKEANECVVNSRCAVARNVTLVPREGAVWRSYFLTDFELKKYYTHCMAPKQQWHKAVTCDGVVSKT
jgi:hypothetical protein